MTSNRSHSASGEKNEKRSFWGVRDKEREKEKEREREVFLQRQKDRDGERAGDRLGGCRKSEDNGATKLTQQIGYLTATAAQNWTLMMGICDGASASEDNAKAVVGALISEFKYGAPPAQFSAAILWSIILLNSSENFISQSTSQKFLDTLEELLSSPRTSPVVREYVLEVIAAEAYESENKKDVRHEKEGFRGLWERVRSLDKPEEGIPFDKEDTMLRPNVSKFSNPGFKGPRSTRWLSESDQLTSSRPRGYDPLSTNEKSETAGASNNITSGNMFSGNSYFMGISYRFGERERATKLTHMIGYLTATATDYLTLMMDICDGASASEANAKAVVGALISEFKYGAPPAQLSAAILWAIMLRNSSEIFTSQSTSRKFLDTLEELLSSPRTSSVVRERVLQVVAAAAYASENKKGVRHEKDGFRGLWRRVRPLDQPEEGIPFDKEDTMLRPNVSKFSNPGFKGPRRTRWLSESDQLTSSRPRGYDPLSTNEKSETAGACNNTTSGSMFSGNSCIMGGSYYNVKGNAHFSSLFQVSFGFEILYRNTSASAFHDSRARFPPPRCHSSTRKEILAEITDQITETPSSSKIFYLFGSEGTGKSAIAQTIAEYCKANNILGASFFFSRESSERNTDKNLIATLAYQLCVSIPELKLFIVKAVEDDLSTFQKDVDTQMERLILKPIIQTADKGKTLRYPILIVIDGLDECEEAEEQCAFLRAISGAIGRYSLPLHFFITSRKGGQIVKWLNEDRTRRWILDLDQNHIQTKRDIEAYICSEFERIRIVHHIPESVGWPSQAIIQMIVSKTNMLFSRASEIMAFIDPKNAPSPSPETQLELILGKSGPCV